jgi:hypothetical protein
MRGSRNRRIVHMGQAGRYCNCRGAENIIHQRSSWSKMDSGDVVVYIGVEAICYI